MAKHPHKLILMNKKTWRCVLNGCNFFVHIGLAHILSGKTSICWNCEEQFILDEYALKDEMPRCNECRLVPDADINEIILKRIREKDNE